MAFEEIIGNEKVKEILTKTIEIEKIVHSYLFTGIEGIGKSIFAKEFAKMILCLEKQKPCGHCKSCLEMENENQPDFYLLSAEDTIKVDDIRFLQTKVAEKPIIAEHKVYIINNSEKMTKEAQNCLLKTLEEPPEYITIILITSNENLILNTIKSRCMKINFQKISTEEIKQVLEEKWNIKNVTNSMLETYGGSIGKALKLREKTEMYAQIEKQLKQIETSNLIEVWNHSDRIYNKEEILEILEYMNVYYFDLLKNQNNDKIKYAKCIEIIEKVKKNLKANSNFDMSVDYLLMKIWEELNS